jgi:hypothetical protein
MLQGPDVRRVFTILLAVILMPSIAMASWFRCEFDGTLREACCCPGNTHDQKDPSPPPDTSLSEACCCTVIQIASADPSVRNQPPASIDHAAPPMVAVAQSIEPARRVVRVAAIDRPRALGDPPDSLFSRRCSLLL